MIESKRPADRLFTLANYLILLLVTVATAYPFLHVVFSSLSDPSQLMVRRGLMLGPAGFSTAGYRLALSYPGIGIGYANTLYYVALGTALNLAATTTFAYVLAVRSYWRKHLLIFVTITMFFSGGLIPIFLNVKALGLYDSRMALILPGLISTWNLIILRTFLQGIPESLVESARMDGAGHATVLFRIMVPLSLPALAVMVLYYGVSHWNSWFHAMIFLRDRLKYPLQLYLREILIQQVLREELSVEFESLTGDRAVNRDIMRNAVIVIATAPVLVLYPFLQKYFVKGVMIGALKG